MNKRRKETLTDEDKRLWRQIAQTVVPMHPLMPEVAPPASSSEAVGQQQEPPVRDLVLLPNPPQPPAPAKKKPKPKPLVPGEMVDIDASTSKRFAKGNMAIDARLDLHGMGAEAAYLALRGFITGEYTRGSRCLLVITGKGGGGPKPWIDRLGEDRGILRRSLPHWLNEPATRARVLAVTAAKGHHGGAGAFYILLKRRREDER
ncbi:Smr/MutS family protein [Lacibacterium aquatile]|uniref:Smr/MutS family protein n=1 Tax=Lacibacterium aquatile TaxID=1168082 RepID=A0ABW5DMK4_9PROT